MYFHALVNMKRAKNSIIKIQCDDGSIFVNVEEIANLPVLHFQNCLNKNFNPVPIDYHSFLPNLITIEDNVNLSKPPSFEKVKDTVWYE